MVTNSWTAWWSIEKGKQNMNGSTNPVVGKSARSGAPRLTILGHFYNPILQRGNEDSLLEIRGL